MKPAEYLRAILISQTLSADSDEMKTLQSRRADIEALLKEEFGSSPTIRYGGSKAKGTLIREAYDLDVVCYFPRDDDDSGGTLEELYTNVKTALEERFSVEPKTSALRVRGTDQADFHIDVVPGRFINEEGYDAFLYISSGEKTRLKTNIETHIAHVRDSGVVDAIKLMKLWRTRNRLQLKTFVLELAVIKALGNSRDALDKQVIEVLTQFRDEVDEIKVEDPANPNGNDLSAAWSEQVRSMVSLTARLTLSLIASSGWEAVFGKIDEEAVTAMKIEGLRQAAAQAVAPSRPWLRGGR